MIYLSTPLKEFYEILIEGDICDEAIDWLKPQLDGTVGEALDNLPVDKETSWAAWLLGQYCNILSAGARKGYIEHIKDPMTAFRAYIMMRELSDEDDKLLEAKFKGKLPRAEKELKRNTVRRRKTVLGG